MKIFILLLITCLTATLMTAKNTGTIPQPPNPGQLTVCAEGIYVFDRFTIYRYSHDLKPLGSFGREGEGPGELKKNRFHQNFMFLLPDRIFVDTVDKMLLFSKTGKLLEERKKGRNLWTQTLPAGNRFVVKQLDRSDNKREFITIVLYNSKLEKIKELYRQISPIQITSLDILYDSPYLWTTDDKIFIEQSPKGFLISVYDTEGKHLYNIDKPYEKIKVTPEDREKGLQFYKETQFVKDIGFDEIKKRVKFLSTDIFHPIQHFRVIGKKLYVKTFKRKKGMEEYVVMDLKGKELARHYLPPVAKTPLSAQINGIDKQLYGFYNDAFYYLKENEEEEWELHVIPLNAAPPLRAKAFQEFPYRRLRVLREQG